MSYNRQLNSVVIGHMLVFWLLTFCAIAFALFQPKLVVAAAIFGVSGVGFAWIAESENRKAPNFYQFVSFANVTLGWMILGFWAVAVSRW